MEQKNAPKSTHEHEEIVVDEKTARDLAATAEKLDAIDSDVDDLLADIDDILEENSEEFVTNFVQKGGQ